MNINAFQPRSFEYLANRRHSSAQITSTMCTILISKNTIILTCIFIAIIAEAQCKTCCRPPWVGFQRNCYLFVQDAMNHPDAEAHCQGLSTSVRQAHLTSILSEAERNFIKDYVDESKSGAGKVWTGFNDKEVEGSFKWTDGKSSQAYTSWSPGEPNSHTDDENCVEIYLNTNNWNDAPCDRVIPFVCKIPQHVFTQ